MADQNLVNVTSIYGRVAGKLVTGSATDIIAAVPANKIYKVNSLIIANINGTTSADITVDVYKNQANAWEIAHTVAVPADSSVVIIGKENSIYLNENDSLRVLASATNALHAVASYEEISSV